MSKLNITRDWVQLTKWLNKNELEVVKSSFYQYHGNNCEDRVFTVVNNKRKNKYAVYYNKALKFRRVEYKDLIKSLSDEELLVLLRGMKQEGVSILQTFSKRL